MADPDEQCNCDQALALCDLLADARDLIAEYAPLIDGLPWMERLHRSPAFRDPRPPDPHPSAEDCDVPECIACGLRDCPSGEPLHFHHDGCPECSREEPEQ
jgi:hypothetical protein